MSSKASHGSGVSHDHWKLQKSCQKQQCAHLHGLAYWFKFLTNSGSWGWHIPSCYLRSRRSKVRQVLGARTCCEQCGEHPPARARSWASGDPTAPAWCSALGSSKFLNFQLAVAHVCRCGCQLTERSRHGAERSTAGGGTKRLRRTSSKQVSKAERGSSTLLAPCKQVCATNVRWPRADWL